MMRAAFPLALLVLLFSGSTACEQTNKQAAPPPAGEPAAAQPATATKAVATPGAAASSAVARIVFVDQKEACACTKKRIDGSWKAIIDVLGFPPDIDVERIHMDTQQVLAEPYKKMKPVMVSPGIYFFDKQGKLATMLQGDVSADQIKKAIGSPRS